MVSGDAVGTEVGLRTWRCVVQTLTHQQSRLKDHSLTNWKPMKCRENQSDVVMTTSAGDQTISLVRRLVERARWCIHAYPLLVEHPNL